MEDSPWGPYLLILLFLSFSAYFSASEIAFAAVNKLRLKKLMENGSRRAQWAHEIYDKYDFALATILIGNNLVNIGASSLATVIAITLLGEEKSQLAALIAAVIMTVLILMFGEIVPKILAKEYAEEFAMASAPWLKLLMTISYPLILILSYGLNFLNRLVGNPENSDGVTEEDLFTIFETVEDEGVIDEERSDLLQSALEFSEVTAQEVITPRVDMIALDVNEDPEKVLTVANQSVYSRIPVYEESIDNIIGFLYLNHYFEKLVYKETFTLRSLLMEPVFLHKSMRLPAALAELKRRKTHMAIVTDEYGGTMGVITMEDILEELVGEIWDEADEVEEDFLEIDEYTTLIDADISIFDFLEYYELDEDEFDSDYTTLGGWVIEMLDGFPQVGANFQFENLSIEVDKTSEHRILSVRVTKSHPQI
jgi:CBS domain containing-hemolysin-like protein